MTIDHEKTSVGARLTFEQENGLGGVRVTFQHEKSPGGSSQRTERPVHITTKSAGWGVPSR